eukprot:9989397-Lingulodinium_polyedra.AAC.1
MYLFPGGPLPAEVGTALTEVVVEQGLRRRGLLGGGGPDVPPCSPNRCLDLPLTLKQRPIMLQDTSA